MATDCIDGLGSLSHQQVAGSKHDGRRLLLRAFYRHETHRWPLDRFADRFRIGGTKGFT
jgi:hypothetical protein